MRNKSFLIHLLYLAEESGKRGMKMLGGIVAVSDEKAIAINLNSEYMPYAKNPDQWTLLSALI